MNERFTREVTSVASLSDPNVVTLFDVATHDDLRYAVMEFVNGQTLRELIPESITSSTAVRIARVIASGLSVLWTSC